MKFVGAAIVLTLVIAIGCASSQSRTESSKRQATSHQSPMHKWIDQQAKSPARPVDHEYLDLNKNGKKDAYEDPALPIERRIDDLIAQMNLDEKTCQLATLYGYQRVLRDAGYRSDIFVETADPRLEPLTRDYRELVDASRPDNLLLHHFSIGSKASRTA